jgi:hypothetical protein
MKKEDIKKDIKIICHENKDIRNIAYKKMTLKKENTKK